VLACEKQQHLIKADYATVGLLANIHVRYVARPSVVCLSATFVHPTQPVDIFRNFSTPFITFAIH